MSQKVRPDEHSLEARLRGEHETEAVVEEEAAEKAVENVAEAARHTVRMALHQE